MKIEVNVSPSYYDLIRNIKSISFDSSIDKLLLRFIISSSCVLTIYGRKPTPNVVHRWQWCKLTRIFTLLDGFAGMIYARNFVL